MGVEAVLRLATTARSTLAADRPPVENYEVPDGDMRDTVADSFDDACGLMA